MQRMLAKQTDASMLETYATGGSNCSSGREGAEKEQVLPASLFLSCFFAAKGRGWQARVEQ